MRFQGLLLPLPYRGFNQSLLLYTLILIILAINNRPVSTRRVSTRQLIPRFLPTQQNVTVHKGELAVLRCHIHNLGPKMVVWRKLPDESPLTIGDMEYNQEGGFSVSHADISETESKWDLLIKNVQPFHSGIYTCQISSKETYKHTVTLHVLDKPFKRKPELFVYGTQYVNKDGSIRLTCNATGARFAPDEVDWFFEGNRVHTSNPKWFGRTEIIKHRTVPGRSYISELIIHESKMTDQGTYVCRSSNLNVDSLKVHVLNAGKKPVVPRGAENEIGTLKSEGSRRFPCLKTSIYLILLYQSLTCR